MGARLGQHFLHDKRVVDDIVAAADIQPGIRVIEIGPGKGVLTRALLEGGAQVTALEKDEKLVSYIQEHFTEALACGHLILIHTDALEYIPIAKPYAVIANIPYYITGALIRKFLTAPHQPNHMVLLIQKEVAERIVARDGKESMLSISVQAYGKPRIVRTVKKRAFRPAPKVDSAVIRIEDISRDFFTKHALDEERFFELVRKGFAHKRKQLAKNLSVEGAFLENIGLDAQTRAEDVLLEQWALLAQKLKR